MKPDGRAEGAPENQAVASQAQLSSSLPPFSPLHPETLATLLQLVRGAASIGRIWLSDAIVVQVWFVFCGPEANAELAQAGCTGLYSALYALSVGEAPPPPSPAQLDGLRLVLQRKQPRTGTRLPGLIIRFKAALKHDRELRGLSRDDAMRRLLCQWRQQPFTFAFCPSGGGAGGGGGDPGGGGSSLQQGEAHCRFS